MGPLSPCLPSLVLWLHCLWPHSQAFKNVCKNVLAMPLQARLIHEHRKAETGEELPHCFHFLPPPQNTEITCSPVPYLGIGRQTDWAKQSTFHLTEKNHHHHCQLYYHHPQKKKALLYCTWRITHTLDIQLSSANRHVDLWKNARTKMTDPDVGSST